MQSSEPRARRKVRLLGKRELQYLLERLKDLDMQVLRAFVVKRVDEREATHISYYRQRQELWFTWKSMAKLDALLTFLLGGILELFGQHTTGTERFARFLVAWYNFVGSLACSCIGNDRSNAVWLELTSGCSVQITDEDRSAAVFAVASSVYTFMQLQVSIN